MWCPVTGEPGEQREIVCVVGDAESLECDDDPTRANLESSDFMFDSSLGDAESLECDDEGELLELDGDGALLE